MSRNFWLHITKKHQYLPKKHQKTPKNSQFRAKTAQNRQKFMVLHHKFQPQIAQNTLILGKNSPFSLKLAPKSGISEKNSCLHPTFFHQYLAKNTSFSTKYGHFRAKTPKKQLFLEKIPGTASQIIVQKQLILPKNRQKSLILEQKYHILAIFCSKTPNFEDYFMIVHHKNISYFARKHHKLPLFITIYPKFRAFHHNLPQNY